MRRFHRSDRRATTNQRKKEWQDTYSTYQHQLNVWKRQQLILHIAVRRTDLGWVITKVAPIHTDSFPDNGVALLNRLNRLNTIGETYHHWRDQALTIAKQYSYEPLTSSFFHTTTFPPAAQLPELTEKQKQTSMGYTIEARLAPTPTPQFPRDEWEPYTSYDWTPDLLTVPLDKLDKRNSYGTKGDKQRIRAEWKHQKQALRSTNPNDYHDAD